MALESSSSLDVYNYKKISIILLDTSARSRLHLDTIQNQLLPLILKTFTKTNIPTLYVVLGYGDYPPSSLHVVQTIYFGNNPTEALDAIRNWSFVGGGLIRNALHEGVAAAIRLLRGIITPSSPSPNGSTATNLLAIISTTIGYEAFYTEVRVRKELEAHVTLEDLLRELRVTHRTIIYYFVPSVASTENLTMVGLLEKVFVGEKEVRTPSSGVPSGWSARIIIPEGHYISSSSSSSSSASLITSQANPSPSMPVTNLDETGDAPMNSAKVKAQAVLENAVKAFINGTLLKLPVSSRAEAIKEQLESPAFSAEYKRLLLTMVKQQQQQQQLPPSAPMTASRGVEEITRTAIAPNRPPLWQGRLAFRNQQLESYFDIAAYPIANPRSLHPNYIPSSAEFHSESWPPVLAVSSFVAVQSPAVLNSVPGSKLVELIPMPIYTGRPTGRSNQVEEEVRKANMEIAMGLRSVLAGKHLVGLVRLGGLQAMLVAARPHQLVGMVISRPDGVSTSSGPLSHPLGNTVPSANGGASSVGSIHRLTPPLPNNTIASIPARTSPRRSSQAIRPPSITPIAPTPPIPMTLTNTSTVTPNSGTSSVLPITTATPLTPDEVLTPDAILRLHRPASAPLESPTVDLSFMAAQTADVFTSLSLGSSMDDLRDYNDITYDNRPFEDAMFGDF